MQAGLLLALLAAPATAAEPTWAVHGVAGLGRLGEAEQGGVGLGGAVGLRPGARWSLELAVDGGVSWAGAPLLAARPQVRLWLSDPTAPRATLSAAAGAGLLLAGDAAAAVAAGVDLDLGGRGRLAPRLGARLVAAPGDGQPATLLLSVGVAAPRPPPPPPPLPPPAPPAPDPWVWVPHPVQACVLESTLRPDPAAASSAAAPSAAAPSAAAPSAQGALAAVSRPDPLDLEALLHPEGGSLVIVARPGDELVVGGHQIPLDAEGTAVLAVPAGAQAVTVRGAGRERTARPSVADGYATWIRVGSDASSHLVLFALGSAELDEQAAAGLRALAARAGGWRFRLVGQFSPEGDLAANRALATARAEAVRASLVEAGLDPARLEVAPIEEARILAAADEGAAVEQLRSCRVDPIPPEEEP